MLQINHVSSWFYYYLLTYLPGWLVDLAFRAPPLEAFLSIFHRCVSGLVVINEHCRVFYFMFCQKTKKKTVSCYFCPKNWDVLLLSPSLPIHTISFMRWMDKPWSLFLANPLGKNNTMCPLGRQVWGRLYFDDATRSIWMGAYNITSTSAANKTFHHSDKI